MIKKYRNQGMILVLSGLGLILLALGVYGATVGNDFRRLGGCLAVIMTLIGVILYQWGGVTLAKAKGYSTDVAGGIIAVGLLCCGFVFFIAPLVVLFLKDKTRHRSMSRPVRRPYRRATNLEIWSISLSALAWIALVFGLAIPVLHAPPEGTFAQLAAVVISAIILIAPIVSAVLAIIVLRRHGADNTVALI